jgi:hypothetical protein
VLREEVEEEVSLALSSGSSSRRELPRERYRSLLASPASARSLLASARSLLVRQ